MNEIDIIIVVEGGLVSSVYAANVKDTKINVNILDYDNEDTHNLSREAKDRINEMSSMECIY